MMSSVCAVQIKGGEFTKEVVWGPPNLHMRLTRHSNISKNEPWLAGATRAAIWIYCLLAIRREPDRPNRVLEVEVV